MRCIVVRKLTDETVTEATNSTSAKTAVDAPTSGVNVGTFSGAYIVHPPENVPPWKNETPNRMPEKR